MAWSLKLTVIVVVSAVLLQRAWVAFNADHIYFHETCDMARSHEYHCEEHKVVTEDGYILTMHRIPFGRNSKSKQPNKLPLILMHGGFVSSSFWTIGPPDMGFAYLLAEKGYDVWMGNTRGNKYSLEHETMSSEDKEFWRFSYEDTGYYDIPAFIDYALNSTGAKKVHYIGHSMGGGNYFIAMSRRPEYNSKIRLMVALVPGVYAYYATTSLASVCNVTGYIRSVSERVGCYSFAPYNEKISRLLYNVLGNERFLFVTKFIWRKLFGSSELLYLDTAQGFLATSPAGVSFDMVEHLCQFGISGEFKAYDYQSSELNSKRYGQSTPPFYDLSKVTSPVVLFRGDGDNMVPPENVERVSRELPNLVKYITAEHPAFNHLDFALAKEAPEMVLKPALAYMKKY